MHDAMEAHTPEIEPSYLCLFATVFWMTYEHFPTLLLYSSLAWLALLYCFLHMTRARLPAPRSLQAHHCARGGLAALERGNPHVRLTRWADWDDRVQRALGRRDGRAFKVVFMLSLVHLALTQALWFFLAYKEAYRPLLKTAFGAPSDNALSGDEAVAAWHGTVMPFTLVRWVLVWILELFVWSHLFLGGSSKRWDRPTTRRSSSTRR